MFNQATSVVIYQYAAQALLALIVMLLLLRFYRNYQNKYFQYWSWSWLGLIIFTIGSASAILVVMNFETNHPLRTATSIVTLSAGIFQAMWLLIGSYELSFQKEFNRNAVIVLSFLIVPFSLALVLPYTNIAEAAAQRLFLRVGIRSLIAGASFILSALLLLKLRKSGIGVLFIMAAFLIYGLLQMNYFISFLTTLLNWEYRFQPSYNQGIIDFFLQAMMGLGMIISVLELERVQLQKANSELDTFLYRASHDLRAPLTAILGLTAAIKQIKDRNEVANFIDLIQLKVHQADKVIKDIITLRKGQNMGLNIKEVNVKEMITRTFDMLTSPTSKKIQLILQSEQDTIATDEERLETAITNIISNAIKYHNLDQNEPMIIVSIEKVDDDLRVIISDNGSGIDNKYLPKIFDMFYRANQSSKGSGLGLYLTKDALDKIESKIEVKSAIGTGTSFKIHLKNLSN